MDTVSVSDGETENLVGIEDILVVPYAKDVVTSVWVGAVVEADQLWATITCDYVVRGFLPGIKSLTVLSCMPIWTVFGVQNVSDEPELDGKSSWTNI